MPFPTASLPAFAAIVCGLTLQAQTVTWIPAGHSTAPSARDDSGIVYDTATRSTVLFGGAAGQTIYGDTWMWNGSWHKVLQLVSPSPRQGAAFAYDGAAGKAVLFGGSPTAPVGTGTAFGDTWIWDGSKWTQQFPATSPPARVWSSMAYDAATGTVVLFGGTNSPGGDNSFNDTWEWNGIEKTWTELHPLHHPSARTINPLVYDPKTRTVVLFGGVTSNLTPLDDTWTWNGSDWLQRFPASSPTPRNGPGIVYDSAFGAVVLFGGAVGTCCSDNLNDTWIWNGVDWTEIYPADELPSARDGMNMAYDPLRKIVLMFGGTGAGGVRADTWFLAQAP